MRMSEYDELERPVGLIRALGRFAEAAPGCVRSTLTTE